VGLVMYAVLAPSTVDTTTVKIHKTVVILCHYQLAHKDCRIFNKYPNILKLW